VFERADFDHFAREHPRLEHKLLERTLGELDRTRRWMLLLGRMNAEQKVASFLLEMADRLGNGVAGAQTSLILPVSRQQIADVLGLTIETVSRQLTRLRSAGAIELPSRREIILRDRADLEQRAG
jgi:CRP/FNR family transcriptional regulator